MRRGGGQRLAGGSADGAVPGLCRRAAGTAPVSGAESTPDGRASAIAAAIAALPGVAENLVLRHVDDGREPWPCRIRTYAEAAVRRRPSGP